MHRSFLCAVALLCPPLVASATDTAESADEAIVARVATLSRRTQQELAFARYFRATERIACLDTTLTQINTSLRNLEAVLVRRRAASQVGNEAEKVYLQSVIRTVGAHAAELELAVRACVNPDLPASSTVVEVLLAGYPSDRQGVKLPGSRPDPSILPSRGRR